MKVCAAHSTELSSYADNTPYGSDAFLQDISANAQTTKFSGVGDHYKNDVTEQGVRTVTYWAQLMLLHATIHWPVLDCTTIQPYYSPLSLEQQQG